MQGVEALRGGATDRAIGLFERVLAAKGRNLTSIPDPTGIPDRM